MHRFSRFQILKDYIAISDAVRTSLGPRGMDKMVRPFKVYWLDLAYSSTQIQTSKGDVVITNDGATILKSIQALHPAAKMVRVLILVSVARSN